MVPVTKYEWPFFITSSWYQNTFDFYKIQGFNITCEVKSLTCRRRKFKKAGTFVPKINVIMHLLLKLFFKRNMFHDLHLAIFANSKFGRCKMLLFLSNPYVKKLFTEYLKQSICFVKAALFVVCKLNPSHYFDNLTTCDQGMFSMWFYFISNWMQDISCNLKLL